MALAESIRAHVRKVGESVPHRAPEWIDQFDSATKRM